MITPKDDFPKAPFGVGLHFGATISQTTHTRGPTSLASCFPPTINSTLSFTYSNGFVGSPYPGYFHEDAPPQFKPVVVERQCECGVDKAGVGGLHSSWCPKA